MSEQMNVDLFSVIGRLTTEKLVAESVFKERIAQLEARIKQLEEASTVTKEE